MATKLPTSPGSCSHPTLCNTAYVSLFITMAVNISISHDKLTVTEQYILANVQSVCI